MRSFESLRKGLFEQDEVQLAQMRYFLGGTGATNANGRTYTGDNCSSNSEGSASCTQGYSDDIGAADASK